jgi:beta-glucosidase-like glycosyl hydrolase
MIFKSAPVSSFIEDLLSQMTTLEKVAMLAGTNMWYTVPIERLGIPSLKMTDGPNGARGYGMAASESSYLLTKILRDEWGFDGVVVSALTVSSRSRVRPPL